MPVEGSNIRHGNNPYRNASGNVRNNVGGNRFGNFRNNVGGGNRFGNGGGGGHGGGGGYELRGATAKETLFEVLHVVFKRKRMIILVFLAITIPSIGAVLTRQAKYIASAKVNIATSRADMTIQPTDMTALSTVKLNQSFVNSEVHVISSRDMLERVVRNLAVANTEGGVVGLANAAGGDADLGDEVLKLKDRIGITPIRASNVIEISYVGRNPQDAAEIVNKVVDEYLGFNAEVHGQKGLTDFYEEQSALLEQNLRRAEETLRDFSFREGMVSPEAEITAEVASITKMEQDSRHLDATVVGSEEKLRIVREQLAEQPPLVKRAQFIDVNPVVKQLRSHVIDRRVDRIALLRRYTENERLVRDNLDEIDELQAELDDVMRDQPTVVTQQIFRPNPVYESRLEKLLDLEANLKEHRARKLAEEEAISRTRRRLVLLKQKALDFRRLELEVDRRRSMLELYEKRGQEARISEAMDKKQLVNVEVLQRPGLPLPRRGRQKGPLVILALICGLAVSFGGAFGVEYLNRTLRFERDVEQFLGLPVVGTIRDTSER